MKTYTNTVSTAKGYSVDIKECRICNRLTNLLFKVEDIKISIQACCQEHANQIIDKKRLS